MLKLLALGGVAAGLALFVTSLRSRWRMVGVTALLVATSFTGSVTPVSAHDSWSAQASWRVKNVPDNNMCVWGAGQQNHTIHKVTVAAYQRTYFGPSWSPYYADCGDTAIKPGGNLMLTAQWFRDAQGPCAWWPWMNNSQSAHAYTVTWPKNVWGWCNNGLHRNVYITMDTWQYVYSNDRQAWMGGWARPATNHCHCP